MLGLVDEGASVGFRDGEIVGLEVRQSAATVKDEFVTFGPMTACILPLEFFQMNDARVPSLTIRPKAELAN